MRKKPKEKAPTPRWKKARLEELVGRAVGDAADEEEAQSAFFETLEAELAFPFRIRLPEGAAVVRGLEVGDGDEIIALCSRPDGTLKIPLLDLPIPRPAPKGAEWIAAYRLWLDES